MNVHVETERFILRDIEHYDVQGMFELDSDPDVHEFLGKKPIQTIDQAKQVIKYIRGQYKNNGIGRWAIIDKQTAHFIGWTGLKYEEELREGFKYYDLGYRIKKSYWGNGIATETAMASLQYGFEKLGLNKIGAAADISHIASNKILKNLDLKLIDTFHYQGVPHNWYAIQKEEWLALIHKNTQ